MSAVKKHITIPKNPDTHDDMSFDFLRSKGIEYIESLGSTFWTDYNTHDPGITILETLCYAITDLGMRISLPIQDLLHGDGSNQVNDQFFKASEILPSNPVTELDYRKLIIDIDPVRIKNCWLRTYTQKIYVNCRQALISYDKRDFAATPENFIKEVEIKGLYSIFLDLDEENAAEKELLKGQVAAKFHQYRNLCEDVAEIKEVAVQPIAVCARIDLSPEADEEYIYAAISLALENYFSPVIPFYSLSQMFEADFKSDEIFEGPLLQHGFIKNHELENAALMTEVRLSDIIRIIMNIEGVTFIKDITINNCDDAEKDQNIWNICIETNKKPALCSKSTFNFTKGVLPVNVNKAKVREYMAGLKEDSAMQQHSASKDKEIKIPEGRPNDISFYSSVTHHFPETYGIGEIGLPESATTARKAKANQLKGYLLFFDQIMASYFKHLNEVKGLLSVNSNLRQTYFTQAVNDIEGFEDLVRDYDTSDEAILSEGLFGPLDDAIKRKNILQDHLLARFSERFSEYAFLMKSLYGGASDEIVLQNKADFLSACATIGSHRGSAFNYYWQSPGNLWDTFNVTGLENRIAGLLGIKGDYDPATGKRGIRRKNLSGLFVQVYDPAPATPAINFRWRIRNSQNRIILSATKDYASESAAVKAMYFAILKIYETSEKEAAAGFKKLRADQTAGMPFSDTAINTFGIVHSGSGQYSFQIIDPAIEDISNPGRVVAGRDEFFATLEELKSTVLELIRFFKDEFSEEGIFLVEHLLLLPQKGKTVNADYFMPICADDCADDCCVPDPYSYKISVVLPGYTYRFSDVDFRNFAEDVIRQEIPSHILGKICWIGHRKGHINTTDNDLVDFEIDFKKFLLDKSRNRQNNLPQFIRSLSKLNSIYPSGRLYDCEDETEDISGKIILGRTNLGTI